MGLKMDVEAKIIKIKIKRQNREKERHCKKDTGSEKQSQYRRV